MKVLIGGFRGNTNSAKLMVDKISTKHNAEKLYLVNSFESSKNQLKTLLDKQVYDLIIMFGQKPKVSTLYLECQAEIEGHKLVANHKYDILSRVLTDNGVANEISHSAGNYLCNHIFYIGLKHIQENNYNTKVMFVHVPSMNNIESIDHLAHVFSTYVDQCIEANHS